MQVVVHYAEVALKGRNRPRFENRLVRNLERALRPIGEVRIRRLYGRLLVDLPDEAAFEAVAERIAHVYGVANFSRVSTAEPTLEAIEEMVDAFVDSRRFESFGVRARRPEKSHPFTSRELEHRLGSRIERRTGARVDLSRPELWVEIHVLTRQAILLHERVPGPGGMPVTTAGRVVSLISGGIDSPVASALAIRRGCEALFAHFHSSPYTSAASQEKVRDLVRLLAAYNGPSTLWLVPFAEIQRILVREAPAEPRIVLYRRFMIRLAERLAKRSKALALVTGESIGQVSSQTLANLDTIGRAATLPILRPVIGFDKAEIVSRAKALGTYDISIEPDEDCCSYLMPRQAATWTRPEPIEAIERDLDVKGMIEDTLARVSEERIEPAR